MQHRILNTVGQLAKTANKVLRAENLEREINICIDGKEARHVATVMGQLKNRMKSAVATQTMFGLARFLKTDKRAPYQFKGSWEVWKSDKGHSPMQRDHIRGMFVTHLDGPPVQSIPTYVAMRRHEYPDACIINPKHVIWKDVWRDIGKGSHGYGVRLEEGGVDYWSNFAPGCDPTLHSLDSDSLVLTLGGYCGWLDLCEDSSAGEKDESYQMHR
ncbi:hypothetical protein B0H13DRAFT_1867182 [Mycena leptocephala]|nr:hypothetical protein B0H13DRAFT_1867182 [Mycena leptocephala]